jgi:hypothetical protein
MLNLYKLNRVVNSYLVVILFLVSIVVTPQLFAQTLVGHWKVDEGSGPTLVDATTNHEGTIFGSPSWVTGKDGLALNLDGSTQYATVPHNSALNFSTGITLAAWIKPGKQGTQYVIKKAIINSTDGYELSLSNPGKVFARFNRETAAAGGDGNLYRIDSQTSYPTDGNTWMHIAATFDGANIRIYINGVEESSPVPGPALIATNSLALGIGAQSDGGTKFQGTIDDARVYDGALSQAEIQALTPRLVGHWAMEENSGVTTLVDSSHYGNDATISGGGLIRDDGQRGYAQKFDGTNDYATVPDATSPILDISDEITLAAWIKPSKTGTQRIIWKVSGSTGYNLFLAGSGLVSVRFNGSGGSRVNSTSTYPDLGNTWMHVSATYDGATIRIYIDGQEENSSTTSFTIGTNTANLSIGATETGVYPFEGAIDDARLYNVALSQAEIQELYNKTWPPPPPPEPENNGAGYALDFDGDNDYVDCGNDASVNITTGSITMEAWVCPSDRLTHSIIKKYDVGNGYELFLSRNSPYNASVRFNNTERINSSSVYPIDGTWTHIAATYDYSTKVMKLYS